MPVGRDGTGVAICRTRMRMCDERPPRQRSTFPLRFRADRDGHLIRFRAREVLGRREMERSPTPGCTPSTTEQQANRRPYRPVTRGAICGTAAAGIGRAVFAAMRRAAFARTKRKDVRHPWTLGHPSPPPRQHSYKAGASPQSISVHFTRLPPGASRSCAGSSPDHPTAMVQRRERALTLAAATSARRARGWDTQACAEPGVY
jgi:hypothetical protein